MQSLTLALVLGLALAAPRPEVAPAVNLLGPSPSVTIAHPAATIVGSSSAGIDTFNAIPFAKPPVGQLRLKPPQSLVAPQGTVQATGVAASCPQMSVSAPSGVPASIASFLQASAGGQEDCLTLNINRPAGTTSSSKLPVLVWIYGGGFEFGSSNMYDGSGIVRDSVTYGESIIFVAMNYRLGGFGFLGGSEILKDGSSNLGLLDQRLALQWVADNIAAFGGDPRKVTIWGESAGAISVWDQMALYDGNNNYKGHPLFRGAIMDSGSVVPANPVDTSKAQTVFNTVVQTAGCSAASDKLSCLRSVPYEVFYNATNSVPGILSYNSVALSYLPRPDGKVLTKSPDILAQTGKYAKVPFILGDQEDEGTLFSLFQNNISTTDQLRQYLKTVFFPMASDEAINNILTAYPDDPAQGSPFGTGQANQLYPQFKRLAAILGDLTFILTRRGFLNTAAQVNPNVPFWSYLSSYLYGTPLLGTLHASDLIEVFYDAPPTYPGLAFRSYYFSFVNHLNPNARSIYPNWPQWKGNKQLVHMNSTFQSLITDDFRQNAYNLLIPNIKQYYI
ncbi:MAG: hypothetical protein GOMPHAMPRED_001960 [Gomphillus americanus]|uniref:Carboxylic ester hydrolase n=1 Tax=Gomphillus americanus TaxID=1940652 RepID=A0A8H3I9M2_9LECA|nr:MAG: hypothetical protein GOMPHAMPRED_001960 [Gomphillus americanus]